MPRWLRRTFIALAWILMATFAYTPTVETSLVRDDFACLASAADLMEEGLEHPGDLYGVVGTAARPLAGLSLVGSHALWSDAGDWSLASALPLRFEQVFFVLATALGLALFVRRLLVPWTGSDQAEAAAWAVALFTSLHPFHLAAVASLSSRGDLLATALGSWACVAFLTGRQERRYGRIVVAGALSLLAALASPLAFAIPALLGLTEFVSAHRYRPLPKRRQTALTTLAVFTGCIALDPILRHLAGASVPPAAESVGWLTGLLIAVEKLGLLLLPINVSLVGVMVYAIAGGLVLLAVQPALIAARSSPRQWGWILCAWTVFLIVSAIPGFAVRVEPGDLSESAALYPTATVMAIGLGVSATALPGWRRWLNPLGLACCFAVLAHMNGLPWKHAAQSVEILRDDLRRARAQHGDEPQYLVLDPPRSIERIDGLGESLGLLLRAPFIPSDSETRAAELPDARVPDARVPGARVPGARVRGLELAAFSALMRERDATEFAQRPFVALVPRPEIEGGSYWRTSHHDAALVPAPEEPTEPPSWRGAAAPTRLDLDPRSVRGLVVTSLPPRSTEEPPRLAWRTRGPGGTQGRLAGVWTYEGQAWFDLFESAAWLSSDRVESLWSEEGWANAAEVVLLARLPRLEVNLAPRPTENDWRFALAAERLEGTERWTLDLIALDGLDFVRLAVEVGGAGELIARGAEDWTRRAFQRGNRIVAWTLAQRVASSESEDGQAIAEATGHRLAAAASESD